MAEFLYYNRQLETLDRERLRQHQDQRLRALMSELATNQFYQAKLSQAGLKPSDIRGAELLGAVPFTTKSELVEEQQAYPPFGRLLTYPKERYRYFHQTSGTTGKPLKWLDTEQDWETWSRCWGYVYRAAGVTEHDTVFCAFSFGPYISHWTAISGAWHIGAMALSGGGMSSVQRLNTLLDNACSVLLSTPSYALHLAEVAAQQGLDLRSSPIRVTIHAGEPGATIPSVKQLIEAGWGATCFDHAGATEAGPWGFDCQAQTGAIHLNEAEFIFEVVHPETGEPLPTGQRGELVITNLGRAGMPAIRYRTGDLVEMIADACPCGRSFARIKGGVLGRADDMLIVRGNNIYPSAIDNLVRSLPSVVEYEVEIRRVGGLDDLLIKVEVAGAQPFDEVKRALLEAFRTELNIRVSVEEAPRNSLPRYEFKSRRYKRVD